MSHKAQAIFFIGFALLMSCISMVYEEATRSDTRPEQDIPIDVQGFKITEPYRIFRFVNQHGLREAFGQSGEESLCGLSKEDFLAYLEWRTEDMDVLHIVLVERYFLGREICLKEAWVFVRNDG